MEREENGGREELNVVVLYCSQGYESDAFTKGTSTWPSGLMNSFSIYNEHVAPMLEWHRVCGALLVKGTTHWKA